MLGANPGWGPSQGEVLGELLLRSGYEVLLTSRFLNRGLRLGDMASSLLRWARRVDVVVVMVFSGLGFGAADVPSWIAKRLHKPVVLALHGGNLPAFAGRHPTWSRRVLSRGKVLVVPSEYLAATMGRLGFEARVIPNILPMESYPFRERRSAAPRLLWMRTFHDIYQPEMAIDVLRLLHSSHPTAHLTMAGQDKGKFEDVRRLAQVHGLGGRVTFPGFLDAPGKQRAFESHDIFINTSRVDNMPVSLAEAAAAGLPVVTTAVGGIPYTFRHERSALLVTDGDAAAMARAVERLVLLPDLAATLSRNGRMVAESCSRTQVRSEWEKLFEEILAGA
jgi:glycosyltransferase involved in cell wall biosynthesis